MGSRVQTSYKYNQDVYADESFAITVTNRKAVPVTVRIVEHLYRGDNWKITASSDPYVKKDVHTIQFPVTLAPNEKKTVTYTVHYTWATVTP